MNRTMTEEEEQSHLFDEKLRNYEDKLVEILLDLAQSKRGGENKSDEII